MAKYSDIIKNVNERAAAGDLYLDPRLAATAEKVYAPTDELAADSLIVQFPNQFEGVKVAGKKAIIPDISVAASLVGLNDIKDGPTKEEQFIDQFPKMQKEWKDDIVADERLGKRGWESIYNTWKAARVSKMMRDIDENRKKVLSEGSAVARLPIVGDVDFDKGGKIIGGTARAISQGGNFLSKIFTPRRYEAIARGDDPSFTDTAGDIVENAAYMIPGATFGKIVSGANKAANAAKFGLGIASAPAIAEFFDATTRGDDDPNADRRDFSWGDVLMGAATNAAVNRGIVRAMGGLYNTALGTAQGGVRGKIRNFVDNIGKSSYQQGKDALARAAEDAKLPRVGEGQISPEILNGGVGGVRSIGEEAGKQAEDFVKFSQIVDNLNYMPKMSKGANMNDVVDYLAETPEAKSLVQRVLEGPYAKDAMNLLRGNKLTPREKLNDIAQQALGTYVVNKYGSRRDADVMTRVLGGAASGLFSMAGEEVDPMFVQNFTRQEHEDFENEENRRKVEKATKNEDLSETDKKYIEIIKNKPNVMKVGYTSDDDPQGSKFKMWLLERGNKLLAETGLVRPRWEAK